MSRSRRPRAAAPGPGQESAWDYPRPPRVEDTSAHVVVELGGLVLADTRRARRVLETSHPPVFYLPADDIRPDALVATARTSYCEYKGTARYYTVRAGDRAEPDAAWYYPQPRPGYESLLGTVAFYPGRMDACYVDGERVRAQPGDFYGGWITDSVVGPFKGDAGTAGW